MNQLRTITALAIVAVLAAALILVVGGRGPRAEAAQSSVPSIGATSAYHDDCDDEDSDHDGDSSGHHDGDGDDDCATGSATPSPSASPEPTETPGFSTETPGPGTETPTPTPVVSGEAPMSADADCSGVVDALDALQVLRRVANLGGQATSCGPRAQLSIAGAGPALRGDMDCDGDVDATDALRILRHAAGLTNLLPPGCA